MSPEAQRIAIAEACGWYMPQPPSSQVWWRNGVWVSDVYGLPNYLNDLNAMHEAEKVIKGTPVWGEYKRILSIICSTGMEFPVDATAAQRAEAFLRTIGKWEDAK